MSRLRIVLTAVGLMAWVGVWAQRVITGNGGSIKGNGSASVFTVSVSGLPSRIDSSYGLESICFSIQHWNDGGLDIYLVSPDGSVGDLCRGNGGDGDHFLQTCLGDAGNLSINEAEAPFTGDFLPEVPIGGLNNGQNPNGTWKLVVIDHSEGSAAGRLTSWKLRFGTSPSRAYVMRPSATPILILQSQGQVVVDEPKVRVRMGLIEASPGSKIQPSDAWDAFDGYANIEVRGRSSQRHPKLSYAIELLDSAGQKAKAYALLGMAKDEDFVLTANYSDKSLLRNFLAYELWEQMGHYAPRSRYVNVVMDGQYRGVYLLGEKVERGKNRVAISKLDPDDNAGDSLTGGYIIKTDWRQGANNAGWDSKFPPLEALAPQPWLYHYPEPDDITEQQQRYIQAFVDSFEVACSEGRSDTVRGYGRYIDVGSFVDMMLLVELSKNVDGYWLSSFYTKERDSKGGRLRAGPVWDFDIAFGNYEYYQGYMPSGWHWEEYAQTSEHLPFWWKALASDPAFDKRLRCRWQELREGPLQLERLFAFIDQTAASLEDSQGMNFEVWPILGAYVWPNAKPYELSYAGEIRRLKEWLLLRTAWMDHALRGNCSH